MIKATARGAAEITGQKGCTQFEGKDERGYYEYTSYMNKFAGKEIELCGRGNNYDYNGEGFAWRKEWLTDIHEEFDWAKVAVDTKVIVRGSDGYTMKRHFAKFENGLIWVFCEGKTSWSQLKSHIDMFGWSPDQVTLWKEGE